MVELDRPNARAASTCEQPAASSGTTVRLGASSSFTGLPRGLFCFGFIGSSAQLRNTEGFVH
jgi:hypothetical protein